MHPTAERLLAILDLKNHWASARILRPGLSRSQLLVHFRHEYATTVRDFPALLARALGQVPDGDVKRALADHVYATPSPELFLEMMNGFGFSREAFHDDELHPAARSYREWLFDRSASAPWQAAVALVTVFVDERTELLEDVPRAHAHLESDLVVPTCMEALARWQRYRDGVAELIGLDRNAATTAPPPVVQVAG